MTRLTRVIAPGSDETPLPDVDMSTTVAATQLSSPVMTASGCAGYGRELDQFFDITEIGAVVTKSIMAQPRSGRPTPRMAETPSGMLNSIGLQGPGIEQFIERDLAWLEQRGATVVVSIAGSTAEEYVRLAQKLRHSTAVAAIEVNISCPNVEDRGLVFACDPVASASVVEGVRRNSAPGVPVLAKLSPDVTDIVAIARACVDAGADGLSLINTLLGVVIDTDTMLPHLGGITGGLSGPAVRPVAVRAVWQVHRALPDVPIVGMGGIRSGLDAFEFIVAGASAVQVGTAIFNDPSAPIRIARELQQVLGDRGFGRLVDAIGYAHRAMPTVEPVDDSATDPADPVDASTEVSSVAEGESVSSRAPVAVALDAPDLDTAIGWARSVGPHVSTVKVGLELFTAVGLEGVRAIRSAAPGCELFLDLKLHDIPNTVAGAARSVAVLEPDLLTVHALGGPAMVAAAAQALPATRVTAVTILTSMTADDLAAVGLAGSPREAVLRLATMAVDAGARALVCSPHEVADVRAVVPRDVRLITPGVRPAGADVGDQARVATPARAIADGADLLVVGRPITAAPDPAAAAAAIVDGIAT